MTARRETRAYDWSGFDNVIIENVEVHVCADCGEDEVVIPRIVELHRTIERVVGGTGVPIALADRDGAWLARPM